VNLVTKPPSANPSTEIAADYGSFVTRKVVVSHSQQFGDIGFTGNATYLGSKGDFTFFDNNGTEMNPNDDNPNATRRNNAFNSLDAILKGTYALAGNWTLDLTSENFYKDQGIPGTDSNQSRDASLNRQRTLNYFRGANTGLFDGRVEAAAALFAVFERDVFDDPNGELFGVAQSTATQTAAIGLNVNGTYYPLPNHAVSWSSELSHERFVSEQQLQNQTLPDQNRLDLAAALQDRAGFLDDRLAVVPSFGYEHIEDSVSSSFDLTDEPNGPKVTKTRDFFNPAVGIEGRPWPWLTLKGNVGRYQRAPNFGELFGNQGIVVGNPQLQPEKVINRDVGFAVSWKPPRWIDQLALEYAFFDNRSDDLITPVQVSANRFSFKNIGAATVRGHELGLHSVGFGFIGLDLNYTHQDAENRSQIPQENGQQLPFLPADELYLQLKAFNPIGEAYYECNLVSGNFTDPANFDEVPSRALHTLGFAIRYWAPLTIHFEARNITNNQISDLAKFPLPGLSFLGGIKVAL
jgi:iron complex outermembrane receptor protein